mmetsp:Transcript_18313/g.25726  ORF Transcript_18313/g.25726 Transcript_18313/m.25726 type:complete len:211 (-) Transcript_18313:969-1601(-)
MEHCHLSAQCFCLLYKSKIAVPAVAIAVSSPTLTALPALNVLVHLSVAVGSVRLAGAGYTGIVVCQGLFLANVLKVAGTEASPLGAIIALFPSVLIPPPTPLRVLALPSFHFWGFVVTPRFENTLSQSTVPNPVCSLSETEVPHKEYWEPAMNHRLTRQNASVSCVAISRYVGLAAFPGIGWYVLVLVSKEISSKTAAKYFSLNVKQSHE